MKREIYIVSAYIVDANGTLNPASGYPKYFDSRSYDNDLDITKRRAEGELSACWSGMCKVDTRQLQTVILMTASGAVLERKVSGKIQDLPDPEPEPEPEPETEPELEGEPE